MAEETRLILPIGRWILREACGQAAIWRTGRLLDAAAPVGVNLSVSQFRSPSPVEDVADILRETGLPPQCLELELTESAVMDDVEGNIATLRRLRALGIRLALDDFGIGYSSLSYLRRIPLDVLKIDRSFVAGIGHNPQDAASIGAIVSLAAALGIQAVAEGVEHKDQRTALRELGCEYGQGYLFHEPMPASEMARRLGVRDADRMATTRV